MPTLVTHEQIPNAIALNSTQFNLSRVLGPAIAGLMLAHWGPVGCFGANALSHVPFLGRSPVVYPGGRRLSREEVRKKFASAPWYSELRAIGAHPALRGGLLTALAASGLCGPLVAFVPVIIRGELHTDVSHFGGAISAVGIGGLVGAFLVLWIDRRVRRRLTPPSAGCFTRRRWWPWPSITRTRACSR